MQVTIVGNAPMKERVGHIIDSSDIVCRFNTFTLCGHEDVLGSKTTDWLTRPELMYHVDRFDTTHLKIIYVAFGPPIQGSQWPVYYASEELMRPWSKYFRSIHPSHSSELRPTLGIIALWFFTKVFGKVCIAGFGSPHSSYVGRMEEDPKQWTQKRQFWKIHDWDFERRLINTMVKDGLVVRLDSGVVR